LDHFYGKGKEFVRLSRISCEQSYMVSGLHEPGDKMLSYESGASGDEDGF